MKIIIQKKREHGPPERPQLRPMDKVATFSEMKSWMMSEREIKNWIRHNLTSKHGDGIYSLVKFNGRPIHIFRGEVSGLE